MKYFFFNLFLIFCLINSKNFIYLIIYNLMMLVLVWSEPCPIISKMRSKSKMTVLDLNLYESDPQPVHAQPLMIRHYPSYPQCQTNESCCRLVHIKSTPILSKYTSIAIIIQIAVYWFDHLSQIVIFFFLDVGCLRTTFTLLVDGFECQFTAFGLWNLMIKVSYSRIPFWTVTWTLTTN